MLILASIVTAILLVGTPKISFAQDTLATALAVNGANATRLSAQTECNTLAECRELLRIAEQRLLKALDEIDQRETLGKFKDAEIAARKNIEDLFRQAIAVKDLIIQYQDELIKKLQKPNSGFIGRLKQILAIAEKVALLALGIGIGRGI